MVTTVALMVKLCKWENIWNAACHRPSLAKLEMKALQPFLKLMTLVRILFKAPNPKKQQIPQKETRLHFESNLPSIFSITYQSTIVSGKCFPHLSGPKLPKHFFPSEKCKLHRTSTSIKTCCLIQELSSNLPFLSFNGQSKGPLGGSSQELLST